MAIMLQKGQKIDLTKGREGLSNLIVGLGWDAAKSATGGLFGGIFGGGAPNIDCDASVIMLDENGKFKNKKDLIYFGNKESECRSVKHSGDNVTGDGDGDDEQVVVNISKVPANIHRLVFVVNIYDCVKRKQHFGMIQNAFIRVVDASNNSELCHFKLTEGYNGLTTLVAGEVYRHSGEWKFNAIGEATTDASLSEIVKRYM